MKRAHRFLGSDLFGKVIFFLSTLLALGAKGSGEKNMSGKILEKLEASGRLSRLESKSSSECRGGGGGR
jgi:hypothetical protein